MSRPIESDFDFYIGLLNHQPGDLVLFDFQHTGKARSARVLLQEPPRPDGRQLALLKLGVELDPLDSNKARLLGVHADTGVYVARVEAGGPAHHARIMASDILTVLGRYYVTNLDEVGQILDGTHSNERLYVQILRVEGDVIYRDWAYLTIR